MHLKVRYHSRIGSAGFSRNEKLIGTHRKVSCLKKLYCGVGDEVKHQNTEIVGYALTNLGRRNYSMGAKVVT